MQSKLDSFFGTTRLYPSSFCLNLQHNKAICQSGFHRLLTKRIRVDKFDFEIEIYSEQNDNIPYEFKQIHNFKINAVPFLKSLLQKAIRRGFSQHALFACYVLLELDPFVLFRRLCIIMIEDVHIHIGFTVLVWYMLVQQAPSQECVEWILGLVQWLCETNHTIHFEPTIKCYPRPDIQDSLAWSLIFRKAYGGLKGDLDMIDNILSMLNQNLIKESNDLIKKINPDDIKPPEIWMFEAIDFHVHPLILHIGDFESEEIRKMMWRNSSSINKRREIVPYRLEDWKKIAWKVRKIQVKYFEALIEKSIEI